MLKMSGDGAEGGCEVHKLHVTLSLGTSLWPAHFAQTDAPTLAMFKNASTAWIMFKSSIYIKNMVDSLLSCVGHI
jgi:hypothetical protein